MVVKSSPYKNVVPIMSKLILNADICYFIKEIYQHTLKLISIKSPYFRRGNGKLCQPDPSTESRFDT